MAEEFTKILQSISTRLEKIETASAPKPDATKDAETALRVYMHAKIDSMPMDTLLTIPLLNPVGKVLPAPPTSSSTPKPDAAKPDAETEEEQKMKEDALLNPWKYSQSFDEGFQGPGMG